MADTKTQKNRKKDLSNPNSKSSNLPVDSTDAEDDLTLGEKYVLKAKPYWSLIALGILSAILLYVFANYYKMMRSESAAEQWRSLSTAVTQSELSGDISSLKEMGTEYGDLVAGNWANQFAGDFEMRRGLGMMNYDRSGGLKMVESAEETFRKIVDAPDAAKTTMLQRRSLFSLAYASESLGKFDVAKELYQKLIDEAGDSAFIDVAKRGVNRCSNPEFADLYKAFLDFNDVAGEAPGALMPDRPSIDPMDIPDFGGGDFGAEEKSGDSSTESQSTESDVEMKKQPDPPSETPAAETSTEDGAATTAPIEELNDVATPVEVPAGGTVVPSETVPVEGGAVEGAATGEANGG
jgi:tetratricopeptide (TPR) repeat protein